MELLRRTKGCRGRLLVLSAVFCWGLVSVSCFKPSQDSEFTYLLRARSAQCFFQAAVKNGTMEVEYQVIAGYGMAIDFSIITPGNIELINESQRSDGLHVVEPTEEGDYQICFDNSFSVFSEKRVFIAILVESQEGDVVGDDEQAGLEEPDGNLRYKLEDIRESMDSLHRRLARSRQTLMVLRAYEARDLNLLEANLWRVSFWSCVSVLVMLCVAFTQVYTVRKLFDDKRRVHA